MKREVIDGVPLVIVMAPVLVQAAAPSQETDIRPLADVWIDQRPSYSYQAQLDANYVIYVSFEITSGLDIDFFICDEENYDLWSDGQGAIAYRIHENVGSYSTSFSVPSDGEWRVVFSNDN